MNFAAYFAAGLFIANGVPHFVNGVSGRKFQSPFASPPGVGLSSAQVNVIWGLVNFFLGYFLLFAVGDFAVGLTLDALAAAAGVSVMAVGLAIYFSRLQTKTG